MFLNAIAPEPGSASLSSFDSQAEVSTHFPSKIRSSTDAQIISTMELWAIAACAWSATRQAYALVNPAQAVKFAAWELLVRQLVYSRHICMLTSYRVAITARGYGTGNSYDRYCMYHIRRKVHHICSPSKFFHVIQNTIFGNGLSPLIFPVVNVDEAVLN